jgi:hypothetical protein
MTNDETRVATAAGLAVLAGTLALPPPLSYDGNHTTFGTPLACARITGRGFSDAREQDGRAATDPSARGALPSPFLVDGLFRRGGAYCPETCGTCGRNGARQSSLLGGDSHGHSDRFRRSHVVRRHRSSPGSVGARAGLLDTVARQAVADGSLAAKIWIGSFVPHAGGIDALMNFVMSCFSFAWQARSMYIMWPAS